MYNSAISRRYTVAAVQNNNENQPHSYQDERQQFDRLLDASPENDGDKEEDSHERSYHVPVVESTMLLVPRSQHPVHISQLNWRLTNGPFAGLTIRAASDGDSLNMFLTVQMSQLQQALFPLAQVEKMLSSQFNRYIKLEVQIDAYTTD